MRIVWWIFFIPIASYEIWWFWLYITTHEIEYEGPMGYHPWYYGISIVISILLLIRLYPIAKRYDDVGRM